MSRWHIDTYGQPSPTLGAADFCPGCDLRHEENCVVSACDRPHLHAFTDAELRARDERIIRAAMFFQSPTGAPFGIPLEPGEYDAIITAAKADQ